MNCGHGGNVQEICRTYNLKESEIIDFSANINPLGLSLKVKEEMIKEINKIERYPDITYLLLRESISTYERINENQLILGNGAAEVIFNIIRGLKPKKVLLPAPTFSEYEDGALGINAKITHYILNKESFKLDEEFLNKINDDIDMIFICNPNNPTGVLTPKEYIIKVLELGKKHNVTIVVDESFLDFRNDKNTYSLIDNVSNYSNLIVVKSLTKFFAFPGIRIGYGITNNKQYIEEVNKISVPWSVNYVADIGARAAIEDKVYQRKAIITVNEEREFLFKGLSDFNELEVYEPSVNYIFLKVLKDIDLRYELLKKGIIIRGCNNYKGLSSSYYRVAVRTRKENNKLLKELRSVLN